MKTSQQPTSQSGADEWTCSLAAFRASLSLTPGDEEARRMTATSGRQCIAPSMKSSPLGLWLRTLLESSQWLSKARFLKWQVLPLYSQRLTTFEDNINSERPLPCNESAQTLKVTDTQSNRFLYRLVPSEPPTDVTGCSSSQEDLLPTPVVVDNPHPNSKVNENGRRYNNKAESSHSMGLADRAMHGLLPTPNASDCHNQNTSDNHDLEKGYLRGVAVDMWKKGLLLPTPLVVEREHPDRVENLKAAGATRINSRVNGEQRPNGLIDFMQFYGMLPTPTAIEGVKWTNTWNPNSQMGQSLSAMAGSGMLPTPIAGDCHNGCPEGSARMQRKAEQGWTIQLNDLATMGRLGDVESTKSESAGQTSRLSPLFTEEMMGFPYRHTTMPFSKQEITWIEIV